MNCGVQGQEDAAWNTIGAQCLHVVSAGQAGLARGRDLGLWFPRSEVLQAYFTSEMN